MGYDANGKWVNPPSVKRQKVSNDKLKNEIAAMTPYDSAMLLYTIRTGEKLSEHDNVKRWYLLRTIVRTHFKRRWGYYYKTKDWYKLDDYYYYDTQSIVNKAVLLSYPEEQRILDLWDMIVAAKDRSCPEHTIRYVLSKLYRDPGYFESCGTMKYGYGISFITGDKKRNNIEKYIPSTFAIRVNNFMYAGKYDFNRVLQLLIEYHKKRHDRYLKGELRTKYSRVTLEFVLNLYASLLRHFAAFYVGNACSYDKFVYYGENTDEAETYINAIPMENLFDTLSGVDYVYNVLRTSSPKLRKVDYVDMEHFLRIVRYAILRHTFLPERKQCRKSSDKTHRNYSRKNA